MYMMKTISSINKIPKVTTPPCNNASSIGEFKKMGKEEFFDF